MYTIFLQGLLFGLAYVMPIGMQNIYIINSAMQKNRRIIIFTTSSRNIFRYFTSCRLLFRRRRPA